MTINSKHAAQCFAAARSLMLDAQDHNEKYELSLETGVVQAGFEDVVRDILSEIRRGLDSEIQALIDPAGVEGTARIFPLAPEGLTEPEFREWLAASLPAMNSSRPALIEAIRSFQPAFAPHHGWLRTLLNLTGERAMALDLLVQTTAAANSAKAEDGSFLLRVTNPDGRALTTSAPIRLSGDPRLQKGPAATARFVSINDGRDEVFSFLSDCLAGAEALSAFLKANSDR